MADLIITLKNMGPIKKGTFKITPLTIFIGPNNTGKSYAAMLVHCFNETINTLYPEVRGYSYDERAFMNERHRIRRPRLSIETSTKLYDYILKHMDEGEYYLPEELANEIIDSTIGDLGETFFRHLIDNMKKVYGCEISGLSTNDEPLEIKFEYGNYTFIINYTNSKLTTDFIIPTRKMKFIINKSQKTAISSSMFGNEIIVSVSLLFLQYLKRSMKRARVNKYPEFIFYEFSNVFNNILSLPSQTSSYYLPAARSGILSAHKALAAGYVRQLPYVGIKDMQVPLLSGTVADFLANIIEIRKRPTEFKREVAFLENQIIQGQIDIVELERFTYPEIHYYLKNDELPLHRTSSMVQELAPLILFLKYIVSKRDNIIIEEPESHLHPSAQRKMARALSRILNSEVNVLLTTHSDYLLKQIQNLTLLFEVGYEYARKNKYSKKDMLDINDVSVYLFDGNKKISSTVISESDMKDSVYESGFSNVIDSLYEESTKLNIKLLRKK